MASLEHMRLTTNGIMLHAVTAGPGDGPLVILLHGFPEFWYGWLQQIEPLAAAGFRALGGVDGFDDDEAQSKCDEGSEVLVRLLAAERHPLEALELAHKLLDAGAGAIERLREERRPVLGR